jgi:hypothetical protein
MTLDVLVSFLPYSSALKMEAVYSNDTSSTLRTARRYDPEHGALPIILSGAVCSDITQRFGKCATLALRRFRVQNSA